MTVDQLIERAGACHTAVSGASKVQKVVESAKDALTAEIRLGNDVPRVELESGYSLMSLANDANCLSVYEVLKPILGDGGYHRFVDRVAEINPKALAQFIANTLVLDYDDAVDKVNSLDGFPLRVVNSQSTVKVNDMGKSLYISPPPVY